MHAAAFHSLVGVRKIYYQGRRMNQNVRRSVQINKRHPPHIAHFPLFRSIGVYMDTSAVTTGAFAASSNITIMTGTNPTIAVASPGTI